MARKSPIGVSSASVVVLLGSLLAGCASSTDGFVEEGREKDSIDQNAVKAVMQGLGAVDPTERPIEYRPRAPLVVPPKRDLPTPQKTASTDPNFPRNPEDVADEQRRAAQEKSGRLPDGRIMTPEELSKYAIPGSGKSASDPQSGRRLTPDELKGQGVTQADAVKRAANPTGRQTLTEPPDVYRQPSPNAPVAAPEEKSSWKPSWWPL